MDNNLAKTYDHHEVEKYWYNYWETHNHFQPSDSKNTYFIPMPPPNITGSLHLGHALNNTLQDILARWKRMSGYSTLWVPGTDHASIATEAKVVAALASEGKSKAEIGREAFLERVWQWKEEYGGTIINQLKRLGCSCDWNSLCFTMDEKLNKAIIEVFTSYYNEGLIYRGNYIVNWCPVCRTTLSDIEVEHEDKQGNLYYIEYPFVEGEGGLIIATTRPETMLGDTGVAVHPEDPRYQQYIGKKVILPLIGREIPIVADEHVEPEFGTGALKITPAHDPNDYEIGLRHNLELLNVIDEKGTMTEAAGQYAGLDRKECRKAVVDDLEKGNYLKKIESYQHAVGHCYRCHNVIEPLVSKQWFVKMKPLVKSAIEVVNSEKVKFFPQHFAKVYLNWLDEIKDWCISRQLWWGHRIPVWYCLDCGKEIVASLEPESCPDCQGQRLEQDPDVLDTWFSSALWPFSILGWPAETEELKKFFPADVLITGRDIIFFWVARMIFSSLKFMEQEPFPHVLITGMVRDAQGRIMSKSKGIGTDPLDVIDEYGADVLRFSLIAGLSMGTDMKFREERIDAARTFTNKLWNAARFLQMNLKDFSPEFSNLTIASLSSQWILSKLQKVIDSVTKSFTEYRFNDAAQDIYEFIWNDFCDWYIEMAKPALYNLENNALKNEALSVLWYVLENSLRLLHPIMPFITEEIWQSLPHEGDTIMKADWPSVNSDLQNIPAEDKMDFLQEIVRSVRNVRQELEVHPQRHIEAYISADSSKLDLLKEGSSYIKIMAGIGKLELHDRGVTIPKNSVINIVRGVELNLPLAGLVDLQDEIIRLKKNQEKLSNELNRVGKQLNNPGFLAKAPAHLVETEKAKQIEYRNNYQQITNKLKQLEDALAEENN